MTHSSALLQRTVEILRTGPAQRDYLISELWPLVQPGVAYRYRERHIAKMRDHHSKNGRKPRPSLRRDDRPDSYKIEMGAKNVVYRFLCTWKKSGIIEEHDRMISLLRNPRR